MINGNGVTLKMPYQKDMGGGIIFYTWASGLNAVKLKQKW